MALDIGSPGNVEAFREQHAAFFAGSSAIDEGISAAFDRPVTLHSPIDLLIFFIGHRCAEDFRELLVLAANGYGWGATAHLRGMFERVVTAAYLHEHPDEAEDFVDYDFVRRWKVAQAIELSFDLSAEDAKGREELRQNFERVKSRFEIPHCQECQKKRLNHTWSRLDLVSMARKVTKFTKLKDAVVPAYYMPLAQAHSTLASAILRVGEVDGTFAVDPDLARKESRRSFQFAHLLVINALVVQHEHFQLRELDTLLPKLFDHFREAWRLAAAG